MQKVRESPPRLPHLHPSPRSTVKLKLVPPAVVILAAALFFTGALSPIPDNSSTRAAAAPVPTAADVLSPGTGGNASTTVDALLARIDNDGDDATLHAQLGLAYIQQSRDSADPSVLPLADQALARSLELDDEDNLEAFVGKASLANARHDFLRSVKWSRRAIELNPYESAGYGLLGDALFELGRVRAADAAYQKMIDVRPDVASYVRGSYALQYHGRTGAALRVMRLALHAAGPAGETAAWVRHQMGDIYAGALDYREAARQNRIGISLAPGYVPPTVGVAESQIAQGRLEPAIEILEEGVDQLPTLEYMITLGDLYAATGRATEAQAQYDEVARKLADYRAAGVEVDADFSIFYADHGLRPRAALREARAAYLQRPTPKMADALGWMLHSLGRDREASVYAERALEGPARDASAMFHAGVIAGELGRDSQARSLMKAALHLDPAFSVVHLPLARRIAAAG